MKVLVSALSCVLLGHAFATPASALTESLAAVHLRINLQFSRSQRASRSATANRHSLGATSA